MAVSKIVIGDVVELDLEKDTIKADKLLKGYTAHDKDGNPITGTCEFDANTSNSTATEDEIVEGATAWANGVKLEGKMPNKGAVDGEISSKDGSFSIPYGLHDGSGKVKISETEKAKLIPSNIRAGVTILDVEGTMSGSEDVKAQSKTVTPTLTEQKIVPTDGNNYLSQVTVKAIPITRTTNASGGVTIKIG
jgi:hypothetical protein